jgi:hypothetical protein
MSLELMSDEQVLEALGEKFEAFRLSKGLRDQDVRETGGVSKDALHKFKNQGGNITLINFVKILRGSGELSALERLFNVPPSLPKKDSKKPVARIRKKKVNKPIRWKE